jgi:hypothetical protein
VTGRRARGELRLTGSWGVECEDGCCCTDKRARGAEGGGELEGEGNWN